MTDKQFYVNEGILLSFHKYLQNRIFVIYFITSSISKRTERSFPSSAIFLKGKS